MPIDDRVGSWPTGFYGAIFEILINSVLHLISVVEILLNNFLIG